MTNRLALPLYAADRKNQPCNTDWYAALGSTVRPVYGDAVLAGANAPVSDVFERFTG